MGNPSSHFFVHYHLVLLKRQFYLENHWRGLWLSLWQSLNPGLVWNWRGPIQVIHGTRVRFLEGRISDI